MYKSKRLWFRNPRCLATLYFTTDKAVFDRTLERLGPDILSDDFTLEKWKKIVIAHRGKNVTSLLMDQSIISGCGNYIKAEVLRSSDTCVVLQEVQ